MSNIAHNPTQSQYLSGISTEFQIEIMNLLIRSRSKYTTIFMSQSVMASIVGCSRRTVIRVLQYFHEMGFVVKKYRHRHTSIYTINRSIFKYVNVLRHKFTSLNWVMGSKLLTSILPRLKQVLGRKNGANVTPSSSYVGSKKNLVSYLTIERGVTRAIPKTEYKKKFRRKITMENVEISPILSRITKKLNLTKWGQIRLICFPDEALDHAFNELCYTRNKNNSFNWFFVKAMKYCTENNVEPHWKYYYDLAERYKMPKDPQYISSQPQVSPFKVKKIERKFDLKTNFQSSAEWEDKIKKTYSEEIALRMISARKTFSSISDKREQA